MNTQTPVQTLAEIQKGSVIAGRYTVEGELGAGGFATVFLAFDREIERQVAIKVLNLAAMASGQNTDVQPFLERFRREARLAARIRHGNVVEIYDFGVLGTQSNPYMVMEMLDGHDLQDEIDDCGGMAPTRALPLFCGALDALGEAHQLGIVHKDLKPANLFINRPETRHEILKVVDFGIAHIGESNESRMTQTGAMFGTPQYLPPEYIQTQVVTPGMDVYQMGLILVELLTGRPVVQEDNPWQCAVKHVTREIDIPVELLDGTLGPILRRALEYEPEDRYNNAVQFADALTMVDPATVGDVRSPDTPYRKIDNTSGQFVPGGITGPALTPQNTDLMLPPVGGATDAAGPTGDLGYKDTLGPLQDRPIDQDLTASIEQWPEEEEGSHKKLWAILALLLLIIVGAGVFATQSGNEPQPDLGEPLLNNSAQGETPGPDSLKVGKPAQAPTQGEAVEAQKDPLNTAAIGAKPDESEPKNTEGLELLQDGDKETPERAADPPKVDPLSAESKPKDSKPSKTRPKPKARPKAAPKRAATPKKKPAPEKKPDEDKPAKNPGMMLAPDLDPNDKGMDLAP